MSDGHSNVGMGFYKAREFYSAFDSKEVMTRTADLSRFFVCYSRCVSNQYSVNNIFPAYLCQTLPKIFKRLVK